MCIIITILHTNSYENLCITLVQCTGPVSTSTPASPVVEKCAKETGIEVVQNDDQHVLSELEGMWELLQDLPHTVHELKEDW